MTPKPSDILHFHLIEEKYLFSASTKTKKKKKPIQYVPCCRSETLTSYSHFTTLNFLHLRTDTYSQHAVYSCHWFWREVLSWSLCLGAEAARLSNYPTLYVTIKTYLWKPSQIQVETAHKDIPANPQQHPQQVLRRQKVRWLQRKWNLPRGRSEALRCSFYWQMRWIWHEPSGLQDKYETSQDLKGDVSLNVACFLWHTDHYHHVRPPKKNKRWYNWKGILNLSGNIPGNINTFKNSSHTVTVAHRLHTHDHKQTHISDI